MGTEISKPAKRELLQVLRERYRIASKIDKTKILDESVDIAKCHRKHAIRLLRESDSLATMASRHTRAIDTEAVREAPLVLREAADRIYGKRLKAVLPGPIPALERHGHLTLDPSVRSLLLTVSPATIDRLLAINRCKAGRRKRLKTTSKSSREIPVRTFSDWKEPAPGFLEVDFVAHGGDSMRGTFPWGLVATDVCSGWTEAVALVARERSPVVEGLELIRRQLPVPIRGIDTDNDTGFINETLQACRMTQQIEFTRSRPYNKNDQAWIEQKNGSVIRRFVGYQRSSGLIAGECLARLYQMVRLYVNYFQPSFKLLSKTRDGAKIKERYQKPATSRERLPAHASTSDSAKESIRAELAPLDPANPLHQIREGQAALAASSSGDLTHGPEHRSLEEFLAKLPDLWREGEVRPTHRKKPSTTRTWRTRKDPFEEVWPEILLRLRKAPDSTAKSLMGRLQQDYPGRFPDVQLRTLQRRIRAWRHVMARSLVHGIRVGNETEAEPIVVGASATTKDLNRAEASKAGSRGAW
jgi:hypothetical protein